MEQNVKEALASLEDEISISNSQGSEVASVELADLVTLVEFAKAQVPVILPTVEGPLEEGSRVEIVKDTHIEFDLYARHGDQGTVHQLSDERHGYPVELVLDGTPDGRIIGFKYEEVRKIG